MIGLAVTVPAWFGLISAALPAPRHVIEKHGAAWTRPENFVGNGPFILREWRAHRGVDFAAPIGTRVRAAGDGKVEFIGTQRGYGNVIVIRHSPAHSTLYAHLNEFAEGLKFGDRVSQGTVIGTVGMTGWATGPHLHYEFRVNNESVDPMTVAMPSAEPLKAADARRLAEGSRELRRQLAQLDVQRLARFE